MGSVVSLVPGVISQETIDLFDSLAAAARRGEVNGAAVACNYPGPGHHFGLHVAGSARYDPTHTRGELNQFDIELSKLTPHR